MSQKVLCPSCDNSLDSQDFVRKHFCQEIGIEYKLYHCDVCKLEFWFPLEFVKEIYEDEVVRAYDFFHREKMPLMHGQDIFLREFGSLGSKGLKLLDIGCGNGSFLHEAQKFGFDVYGVDIDSKSVRFAREELDLKNVYNMSLDEFAKFKGDVKFDFITFFQVLEHQTDPKAFLQKLRSISKSGTIIAGSVPDRERFFAEFTRKGRKYDFPPHHFIWFDKKSLENLLTSCNLDLIMLKTILLNEQEFVREIFDYIYETTKIKFFRLDSTNHMTIMQKLVSAILFTVSVFFWTLYKPNLFFVASLK